MASDKPEALSDPDREHIIQVLVALSLVKADAGDRRGVSGEVSCPACGGRLRYVIAKSNGHAWGACSNDKCGIKFME